MAPAPLSQGHGVVKVAGAGAKTGQFDLGLRSGAPGGVATGRPFGLDPDEQRLVTDALRGKPDSVVGLPGLAIENHLDKISKAESSRRMPEEVELFVSRDGSRVLVENFTDEGSCRDHWVGISRRTPLEGGAPRRDAMSFRVGGSTWFYERGLVAWVAGDVATALRYLAPAMPWSPPMAGAVRSRLSQATYAQPAFKTGLAPLRVKKSTVVQIVDEPHPAGHPTGSVTGGAGPTAGEGADLRLLGRPRAADGYRRFEAAGDWLLVAVPSTWQVGFVSKRSLAK